MNNQPGQKWAATFEVSGNTNLSLPQTETSGGEGTGKTKDWAGERPVTVNGNMYTAFSPEEQAHIYFGANGSGKDIWYINSLTDYSLVQDNKEPDLIGIAPMAGGVYRPGDEITISLIFDEIVDGTKSTGLSSATVLTTDMGTLHYSGGAGTNVLYFTGSVTDASSGSITVQEASVTALLGLVKDMCDGGSASTGGDSVSTDIEVSDSATAPTVTVSDIANSNGNLTATVSGTNAAKLEYAWSEESDADDVTGWQIVAVTGATVTAARTSGIWYLHARATSESGLTAYDVSSIDLDTGEPVIVPTLTATVDNNGWAQSRVITLEKDPEDAPVTVSGPGITDSQPVTGTTYTAAANGVYTFKLTYDGQTITQMVTVSNIDTAAPTVTIQDLTNTSHTQAVTLAVAVSDGQSGIDTVTGTWSNGTESKAADFTVSGNTYTTTSPDESGDWTLSVTATDHAGNTGTDTSTTYRINATRPTLTVDETSRNQRGVTYSYSVEANGNTGITVSLPDGSTTSDLSGTFTITEPETYTISVTDDAGHFVSKTVTVEEQADNPLDGVAPDVRLSIESEAWTKDAVTVTVSVYDAGSAGRRGMETMPKMRKDREPNQGGV